jgi:uncharacterized protein YndB with AHSA1/START domain
MEALMIKRSITIAAKRERVWWALTTPEHFSNWFEAKITFNRLAPGETMHFDFGPEFGEDDAEIATVEPPEWFAYHWTAETGYDVKSLVTFHLETVDGGTRVTVTESGLDALPEAVARKRFEENDGGWKQQLDNIAAYLGKVKDV